jgi:hypothetical protein
VVIERDIVQSLFLSHFLNLLDLLFRDFLFLDCTLLLDFRFLIFLLFILHHVGAQTQRLHLREQNLSANTSFDHDVVDFLLAEAQGNAAGCLVLFVEIVPNGTVLQQEFNRLSSLVSRLFSALCLPA